MNMRIEGQRIKRVRWVHTEDLVVAVDVVAVFPADDPSEPCYESETVELLLQIQDHAQKGDVEWLKRYGKVYRSFDAA